MKTARYPGKHCGGNEELWWRKKERSNKEQTVAGKAIMIMKAKKLSMCAGKVHFFCGKNLKGSKVKRQM